jgi:hypothetical protein
VETNNNKPSGIVCDCSEYAMPVMMSAKTELTGARPCANLATRIRWQE